MPNLEVLFQVHSKGFTGKEMRRGEMIGHRDKSEKFTKDHYRETCRAIGEWMLEYNKKVSGQGTEKSISDILDDAAREVETWPEWMKGQVRARKCDSWACLNEGSEGCKCHE